MPKLFGQLLDFRGKTAHYIQAHHPFLVRQIGTLGIADRSDPF